MSQSAETERIIERVMANADAWIDVKQAEFKSNKGRIFRYNSYKEYIQNKHIPFKGLRLSADELKFYSETEEMMFDPDKEKVIQRLIDHLHLFIDFSQKDDTLIILRELIRAKDHPQSETTKKFINRLRTEFSFFKLKRQSFCPDTYVENIIMEQLRENGRRDTAPAHHDFIYEKYGFAEVVEDVQRCCCSLFKTDPCVYRMAVREHGRPFFKFG